MGKSSSGRQRNGSEASARSERNRNEEDDYSRSRAPTTDSRSKSGRGEDSERPEASDAFYSTSRSPYAGGATPSAVSSYATAYSNEPGAATYRPMDLAEADGVRDNGEKKAKEMKKESKSDRKGSSKSERSRGVDDIDDKPRSAGRGDSGRSRRDSRGLSKSDRKESSRAFGDNDAALPQNQFPGEVPATYSQPYRPPGLGLASDYYGDHGESVASQPGVRPDAPNIIIPADQAHLQEPSVEAKPPPEPSSQGQIGAAASYYGMNGGISDDGAQSTPSKPPRKSSLKPSKHSNHGASPRTSPGPEGRISRPSGWSGTGPASATPPRPVGLAADYYSGMNEGTAQSTNYQSTSSYSGVQPSLSGAPPQPSNIPLYGAAAVAGVAGAAAGAYYAGHHNHADSQSQSYATGPVPGSGPNQSEFPPTQQQYRHRHRHRGLFGTVVDWFRDPEGVAEFERYSEAIGVCKYCFDPNTTPADAPRKHHHGRRRPSPKSGYASNTRVDKPYRYASDEERQRPSAMKKVVTGGIVGYGTAKIGDAIYKQKHGFDDSFSVKSGQRTSQNRVSFAEDEQGYSVVEKVRKSSTKDVRPVYQHEGQKIGRANKKAEKASSRRSSSSSLSSRGGSSATALGLGAAAGFLAGAAIDDYAGRPSRSGSRGSKEEYYSKRVSPRHSYVNITTPKSGPLGLGNFFSPSANVKKGKRRKGIFNFANSSSSSSDADLAFGEGTVLVRKDSRNSRSRKTSGAREDGSTADLRRLTRTGFGLADEIDQRQKAGKTKYDSNISPGRDVERKSATMIALQDHETTTDDDNDPAWEDYHDDDRLDSRIDAALAYGGLSSVQQSQETVFSTQGASDHLPPMQELEPVPTPDLIFAPKVPPKKESPRNRTGPHSGVVPSSMPLYHPQPVAPVSPYVYQSPYETADVGKQSIGSDKAAAEPYGPQISRTESPKQMGPDELGRSGFVREDQAFNRPQLRDSSAAKPLSREGRSNVSFDLTEEQIEAERKSKEKDEKRRSRRPEEIRKSAEAATPETPRAGRNESAKAETVRVKLSSAEARAAREAEIERELQLLYEEDRRQNEERERKQREEEHKSKGESVGLGGVGAAAGIGMVLGALASRDKQSSSSEDDKKSKRKSSSKKSKDRDKSPATQTQQERIARIAAQRVRSTPSPVHEDYHTFFVPKDVAEHLKEHNDKAEHQDDIDATVLEIVPGGASKSRHIFDPFTYRPFGLDPDDDPSLFPWPVPILDIIGPTPPGSRVHSDRGDASPIVTAKQDELPDEPVGEKRERKISTGSKVTWADHDTYENGAQTPEHEASDFIVDSGKDYNLVGSGAGSQAEQASSQDEPPPSGKLRRVWTLDDDEPETDLKNHSVPLQTEEQSEHITSGKDLGGQSSRQPTDTRDLSDETEPQQIDLEPSPTIEVSLEDLLGRRTSHNGPFTETVNGIDITGDYNGVDVPKTGHGFVEDEELPETPTEETRSTRPAEDEAGRADMDATTTSVRESERQTAGQTPSSSTAAKEAVANPDTDTEDTVGPHIPGDFRSFASAVDQKVASLSSAAVVGAASAVLAADATRKAPDSALGERESPRTTTREDHISKPKRASTFEDARPESPKPSPMTEYQSDPEDWERSSSRKRKQQKSKSASSDIGTRPSRSTSLNSAIAAGAVAGGDAFYVHEKLNRHKSREERETFDEDDAKSVGSSKATSRSEDKKLRRKQKRQSESFDDDTRSVTRTPRESQKKSKEKKSGGILSGLFSSSKSDVSTSSKRSSKSSKSEGGADGERSANGGPKKDRSKDRDVDDVASLVSEPIRTSRRDSRPLEQQTVQPPVESRDQSVDDGFVSAEEAVDTGSTQLADGEESFLADRPEMPQPETMDMPMGTDGVSGPESERHSSNQTQIRSPSSTPEELYSNAVLPTVQDAEGGPRTASNTIIQEQSTTATAATPSTASRRLSAIRTTDSPFSPMTNSSPTAVPIHFKRPIASPGAVRGFTSSPVASPSSPLTTPRTRQGRPKSTEFRSGKEFRPLYLVEKQHVTKGATPEMDEEYPSLPSSKTSSAHPSMEDLRTEAQLYDYPEYDTPTKIGPEMFQDRGRRYSLPHWHEEEAKRRESPEYLDSRSATPVPAEVQRAREMHERKEKLKYEFHSPSELLQDPSLHPELPQEHEEERPPSPLPSTVSTVSTDHDQDYISARSRSQSPVRFRSRSETRRTRSRSPSKTPSLRDTLSAAGAGALAGSVFGIVADKVLQDRVNDAPRAEQPITHDDATMSLGLPSVETTDIQSSTQPLVDDKPGFEPPLVESEPRDAIAEPDVSDDFAASRGAKDDDKSPATIASTEKLEGEGKEQSSSMLEEDTGALPLQPSLLSTAPVASLTVTSEQALAATLPRPQDTTASVTDRGSLATDTSDANVSSTIDLEAESRKDLQVSTPMEKQSESAPQEENSEEKTKEGPESVTVEDAVASPASAPNEGETLTKSHSDQAQAEEVYSASERSTDLVGLVQDSTYIAPDTAVSAPSGLSDVTEMVPTQPLLEQHTVPEVFGGETAAADLDQRKTALTAQLAEARELKELELVRSKEAAQDTINIDDAAQVPLPEDSEPEIEVETHASLPENSSVLQGPLSAPSQDQVDSAYIDHGPLEEAFDGAVRATGLSQSSSREDAPEAFLSKRDDGPLTHHENLELVKEASPAEPPTTSPPKGDDQLDDSMPSKPQSKKSKRRDKQGSKRGRVERSQKPPSREETSLSEKQSSQNKGLEKQEGDGRTDIPLLHSSPSDDSRLRTQVDLPMLGPNPFGNDFELMDDEIVASPTAIEPKDSVILPEENASMRATVPAEFEVEKGMADTSPGEPTVHPVMNALEASETAEAPAQTVPVESNELQDETTRLSSDSATSPNEGRNREAMSQVDISDLGRPADSDNVCAQTEQKLGATVGDQPSVAANATQEPPLGDNPPDIVETVEKEVITDNNANAVADQVETSKEGENVPSSDHELAEGGLAGGEEDRNIQAEEELQVASRNQSKREKKRKSTRMNLATPQSSQEGLTSGQILPGPSDEPGEKIEEDSWAVPKKPSKKDRQKLKAEKKKKKNILEGSSEPSTDVATERDEPAPPAEVSTLKRVGSSPGESASAAEPENFPSTSDSRTESGLLEVAGDHIPGAQLVDSQAEKQEPSQPAERLDSDSADAFVPQPQGEGANIQALEISSAKQLHEEPNYQTWLETASSKVSNFPANPQPTTISSETQSQTVGAPKDASDEAAPALADEQPRGETATDLAEGTIEDKKSTSKSARKSKNGKRKGKPSREDKTDSSAEAAVATSSDAVSLTLPPSESVTAEDEIKDVVSEDKNQEQEQMASMDKTRHSTETDDTFDTATPAREVDVATSRQKEEQTISRGKGRKGKGRESKKGQKRTPQNTELPVAVPAVDAASEGDVLEQQSSMPDAVTFEKSGTALIEQEDVSPTPVDMSRQEETELEDPAKNKTTQDGQTLSPVDDKLVLANESPSDNPDQTESVTISPRDATTEVRDQDVCGTEESPVAIVEQESQKAMEASSAGLLQTEEPTSNRLSDIHPSQDRVSGDEEMEKPGEGGSEQSTHGKPVVPSDLNSAQQVAEDKDISSIQQSGPVQFEEPPDQNSATADQLAEMPEIVEEKAHREEHDHSPSLAIPGGFQDDEALAPSAPDTVPLPISSEVDIDYQPESAAPNIRQDVVPGESTNRDAPNEAIEARFGVPPDALTQSGLVDRDDQIKASEKGNLALTAAIGATPLKSAAIDVTGESVEEKVDIPFVDKDDEHDQRQVQIVEARSQQTTEVSGSLSGQRTKKSKGKRNRSLAKTVEADRDSNFELTSEQAMSVKSTNEKPDLEVNLDQTSMPPPVDIPEDDNQGNKEETQSQQAIHPTEEGAASHRVDEFQVDSGKRQDQGDVSMTEHLPAESVGKGALDGESARSLTTETQDTSSAEAPINASAADDNDFDWGEVKKGRKKNNKKNSRSTAVTSEGRRKSAKQPGVSSQQDVSGLSPEADEGQDGKTARSDNATENEEPAWGMVGKKQRGKKKRRATVESAAVESTAVESVAVESAAVESTAVESVAVESAAVESTAVESAPVESAPVESAPVESAPVESAAVESAAVAESAAVVEKQTPTMESEDRNLIARELVDEPMSKESEIQQRRPTVVGEVEGTGITSATSAHEIEERRTVAPDIFDDIVMTKHGKEVEAVTPTRPDSPGQDDEFRSSTGDQSKQDKQEKGMLLSSTDGEKDTMSDFGRATTTTREESITPAGQREAVTVHEQINIPVAPEDSKEDSDTSSNVSASTRERRKRRRSPPVWAGEEPADLPRERALTPPPDHDDIMDTALGVAAGLGFGASQHEDTVVQPRQSSASPNPDRRETSSWSFANLGPASHLVKTDVNRDSGIQVADSPAMATALAPGNRDSGFVPSPATRDSWAQEQARNVEGILLRPPRPQSPTSSTEDVTAVRPRAVSPPAADTSALQSPLKRSPSPVEPTSKDRSSALFNSSPMGPTSRPMHLDLPRSPTTTPELRRTPSIHGHHRSRQELRALAQGASEAGPSDQLASNLIDRAASSAVDRATFDAAAYHPVEPLTSPARMSLDTIHEHKGLAAAGSGVDLQGGASRDEPATPPPKSLGRSKSRTSSMRSLRGAAVLPLDPAATFASSSSQRPVDATESGKAAVGDRDMADIYDGYGAYPGSPVSPTRPPSVRKRQSMQQIRDLEAKVDQLASENRALAEAKIMAERHVEEAHLDYTRSSYAAEEALQTANAQLRERDEEISRLKEAIATLAATHETLKNEHEQRYSLLQDDHHQVQTQWHESNKELETLRSQHTDLSTGMEDIVRQEIDTALAEKNSEIDRLRADLELAREEIRKLQSKMLTRGADDFVVVRDEDYFETACEQLCQHVQQWVLRFSKFSDKRVCWTTNEVRDEKYVDRFDSAVLDGSDVDSYLSDRVKRRDVFMSVVMTMIWEHVFTRYMFGMDRDQRQKLKQLEKNLNEVGPPSAVRKWRALTLTLLSKRDVFKVARESDTEAVAMEIFTTLSKFLPPPAEVRQQLLDSLCHVLQTAVGLSIEMRCQRAEYVMLPPLQPEYDIHGDLARKVYFNASLMNERSGETTSNEALENSQAVVRMVLFPLVVKKGDDDGYGDEEIVVCPAQVLVVRPDTGKRVKSSARVASGGSQPEYMSVDNKSLRAASTYSLAMSGVDMTGGNMI